MRPIVRTQLLALAFTFGALLGGARPVHAGCGDGVLDGGETCDPPGAACTTTSGTAGTCSSSCSCALPACGGDCGARCNDVRDQCLRMVESNRQVTKNACKVQEKAAKQACDEGEANARLTCLGFCSDSPEFAQCQHSAGSNRQACKEAAKTARDDCRLNVDINRDSGRTACEDARQICESTCQN